MEIQEIIVEKFPITLVQFLKYAGVTGRGSEGKTLVREGEISLNGEVCNICGKQLTAGDKVLFDGLCFVLKAE